jgi:propionyl-CoA carboxylase alpha chain
MFKSILVANRGEIACRIIRTARRMGIRTVAVFSDADADALHVELADTAVNIGPPPATQSYLDIARIVAACKATGAEAVHPGYGFLSERPAFPRALAQSGIAFIGPNAAAIEIMGDKIASKRAAAAAGVSIVPGHLGAIESESDAARFARAIGYPVMIKASAGGGGKGMRIAMSSAELADGFARARSEAVASFGDGRLLIEKFIVDPRHIEIQVLGDKHGNIIHLGERECSIQRRNQKVIEEAPSPLLDAATRKEMADQAVALAKAVGYDSAGTVEFVVGQDRSFHFLEMNTRLQVEHPVTELVTGIDLVEQMIRIAAGEKLAMEQGDVRIKGWAIEARVYAEDPYRGFLPSTGRLVRYRPPTEAGIGNAKIRNDTGVVEGGEISVFYDPLIAKLCVHADDRKAATTSMSDALDHFEIEGIQHNIPFLAAIMESERWRSGALATSFIADEFPDGFHGRKLDASLKDKFAAIAATCDHLERHRARPRAPNRKRPTAQDRVIRIGEDWIPVSITAEGRVCLHGKGDGMVIETAWLPGATLWSGQLDGVPITVGVRRVLNGYRLSHRGVVVDAQVLSPRTAELARLMPVKPHSRRSSRLLSPMPGLVLSIAVDKGQDIKAGEPVAVVEAMKMENILRAERDGKVKAIHVKKGDSVAVDSVIMEFV